MPSFPFYLPFNFNWLILLLISLCPFQYFPGFRLGPFIWHSRYWLPKSMTNFWHWYCWCSVSKFSLWGQLLACQFRSYFGFIILPVTKSTKANPKLWQGDIQIQHCFLQLGFIHQSMKKCLKSFFSLRHYAKSCGKFEKHASRVLHFQLCFGDELEQKAMEKFVFQ